jgi:hypothetical protein
VSPPVRHGETDIAQATPKITLSAARDIPFNKLVLSQQNVRKIKAAYRSMTLRKTSPTAAC